MNFLYNSILEWRQVQRKTAYLGFSRDSMMVIIEVTMGYMELLHDKSRNKNSPDGSLEDRKSLNVHLVGFNVIAMWVRSER